MGLHQSRCVWRPSPNTHHLVGSPSVTCDRRLPLASSRVLTNRKPPVRRPNRPSKPARNERRSAPIAVPGYLYNPLGPTKKLFPTLLRPRVFTLLWKHVRRKSATRHISHLGKWYFNRTFLRASPFC